MEHRVVETVEPARLCEPHEGVAAARAALGKAAALCEEHPELHFLHNQALLFQWIEHHDSELFSRLRRLVARAQWHILGGWYLQPDCNLPCAEAMARHVAYGQRYFEQRLGVVPAIALNTAFCGHSRGLVQLLVRSGYRAYLFACPPSSRLPLPQNPFLWEGVDGSRIVCFRLEPAGNTLSATVGEAGQTLKPSLDALWRLGTGGLMVRDSEADQPAHQPRTQGLLSLLEELTTAAERLQEGLPVLAQSLRPWAVGAYTSAMRLKQLYRRAEDRLLLAEKLATCAAFQGRMPYPADELRRAWEELCMCQFYPLLGGTCTETALLSASERLNAVLSRAENVLSRAAFHLTAGQPRMPVEGIPLVVYNPHPYPVTALLECELWLEAATDSHAQPQLFTETGVRLPCQRGWSRDCLLYTSPSPLLFRLPLEAQRPQYLVCRFAPAPALPGPSLLQTPNAISIRTPDLELHFNRHTGEIEHFRVRGRQYARRAFPRLLVVPDSPDPWGVSARHFWRKARPFRVPPKKTAAWFAGISEPLEPVRVVEHGEVCTHLEVLLHHRYRSFACLHYRIPHEGTEIELQIRLLWNERDSLLTLSLPTRLIHARCYGQGMAAVEEFSTNGMEHVAQRWLCLVEDGWAFSCITDSTYGFGCRSGELRLSLLRSPAHAAHPDESPPPDRCTPRMDQGEFVFRFWLNAGEALTRLMALEREAQLHMQPPIVLPFSPSETTPAVPLLRIDDPAVVVTALKQSDEGTELIVRLWEPTGQHRVCRLEFPLFGFSQSVSLAPFALVTLRIDPRQRVVREVDLLERPLA